MDPKTIGPACDDDNHDLLNPVRLFVHVRVFVRLVNGLLRIDINPPMVEDVHFPQLFWTAFHTQKYPEQHAIAESILRRIDSESMAVDIDRIAGKEFLENIRTQHIAYGKMVGGILQRENAMAEDLSEHVRAMGQELVEYATKVIASVDRDDPATIKAAYAALRPIDVFREGTQARAAAGTEPPKALEGSGNGT